MRVHARYRRRFDRRREDAPAERKSRPPDSPCNPGRHPYRTSNCFDGIPIINAGTMLECVLSACYAMPRIAAHRVHLERAHALLESAEGLGNSRGWGRLSGGALLERARLYFSEGRTGEGAGCLERLERLAARYPVPGHCAWSDIHRYATLARAYLASAEERFDHAISTLSALQRELEGVQNLFFALRVETTLATVRFRARQIGAALSSLGGIVAKLAPSGFYHTILNQGAEIGPLLAAFHESAKRTGGSPELMSYVSNLVWPGGRATNPTHSSLRLLRSWSH
jgi:LuxR family transcriptional regulator, maltose regulon positive regulatory protein